ncbi:Metabotropic glutamate receptor 5 [Trichoplax sp. H2]|nr:Metabotropic glutamate receptor 5 [Trichoplax sp. H2]|eukprot:RDD39073.1 Metabotropic glutamate receptor 5 [Trichoplax sp. H2]
MTTPILGIVGEKSDDISTSLAIYTSSLYFLQISYGTSHVSQSLRQLFPYFYRSRSPVTMQVLVFLDIVAKFRWNYISIIVAGSNFAENYNKIVSKLLFNNEICIGYTGIINDNYTQSNLKEIVLKLKYLFERHYSRWW